MKQHFAATARNRRPILRVLRRVLPPAGTVLELASGSGEHGAYFAPRLAPLIWQPSDRDPTLLASIEAWRTDTGASNLRPPLEIDVARRPWPVTHADAVIAVNLLHVSPVGVGTHLVAGAADILCDQGVLFVYGPFSVDGRHASPGNAAFDRQLRQQNPAWGLRALEDVVALAQDHGFALVKTVKMPANNLSIIFRHTKIV